MPTMSSLLALLLLSLAPASLPPAQSAEDFAAEVETARVTYDLVANTNEELLLAGDLEAAKRNLLGVVPEDKRSAAQAFVLGEKLYALDFEQSYKVHAEAFAKGPQHPAVIEQWAFERHRAGEHAEAEALYVELLPLDLGEDGNARTQALRADCLLHLGQPEEACDAWSAADAPRHAAAIEEAAWTIYAPPSPEVRRAELLAAVRAGGDAGEDLVALDELILLDLHWERNPWSIDVHTDYTAHDLELAAARLGGGHYRELAFLARWTSPGRRFEFDSELPKLHPPADNSVAIRAEAEELKLIGGLPKPPENGRLLQPMFQILIDNGVADAEALVKLHEVELLRRAKSRAGDAHALRTLAWLYEQVWDDELPEVQRVGWKTYGDLDCALGLLEAQREELRSKDLVLAQALAANPDDPRLHRLIVEAVEREGDLLVEPLSLLIRAEFKRLEDYQRVNSAFGRLEVALLDRK